MAGLNATAEYNATQPTSCFFQLKTCFLLIFIIDAAACVFTAPYAYHVELARVSDAEDAVSDLDHVQDIDIHGYYDNL